MPITRTVYSNVPSFPSSYYEATAPLSAASQTTLTIPPMSLDVGGVSLQSTASQTLDINSTASWDAITPTDYSTASNRAGTDFYTYACQPTTGIIPKIVLSSNSTYPHGYTASNSRKIGGFHGLCASVGTIANHTLTGYLTGAILPQSVWCQKHRSASGSNVGLVYIPPIKKWCAIYLTSGTSSAPTIVFGGTILDTITYFVANDAARVLKMRMPRDSEFAVLAAGSNEGTSILGETDPVTVTAAVDTAGRRMISQFGIEGCAGVMWQYLSESSYRFDNTTSADTGYTAVPHTHNVTVTEDAGSFTSGNASVDVAPGWNWKNKTGGKGQLYTQGTYGLVQTSGGGYWVGSTGGHSGTLCRVREREPWSTSIAKGFRLITSTIEK